jgi:hypothetical protein
MGADPHHSPRVAGGSLVLSAVLFFATRVLEWAMGPPPEGAAILEWLREHRALLAWANELFFFAAMLLLPGLLALYDRLAKNHRAHAFIGSGLFATTIPVMAMLAIVHGRLMYPMFGLQAHTPEIAELIVATYFGGLHAVALIHAAATVVVSLAIRHEDNGRRVAVAGFVAALFDVAGAYPDQVGPAGVLLASGVFSAWLIALGLHLSPFHQLARLRR